MPNNLAPFILVFYFEEAVLLTVVVSFVLLLWYRHAVSLNMRATISTPEAADPSTRGGTTAALPKTTGVTPAALSLGEVTALNYGEHGLRTRLIITYGAAGAAAAAVLAVFFLISLGGEVNGLQAFNVWYVYAWPTVFTLAALLVLSQRQVLLAFGGYVLAGVLVVLTWSVFSRIALGHTYVSPLQNTYSYMQFLAIQTFAVAIVIITTNKKLRSVSPFVLSGLLVFSFSNSVTTNLLERSLDYSAIRSMINMFGAGFWLIFWFMLAALPIGYACWRALCWLSRSFERKAFSDIQLLVDSWWLIAVFYQTQDLATEFGWSAVTGGLLAFVTYRLVAGFGLALWRTDRCLRGNSRLLLLRVFGFQRRTEKLFDAIAQRWRLFGSVKLIGAADLAMRTIDPSDIISFVGGRIRGLFVRNSADLVQRLETIDDMRDPDGRFRINKFFCRDDTWRSTLRALLTRSDIVLMDLRGFSQSNKGCLFELQQLVVNGLLPRTVFVVDHTTVYRWTQRYAPELEKRSAWYRGRLSFSWRVDETYVRIKGRRKYLYRAIDKEGATLDFYLADRRNAQAAKRFLAKALRRNRDWIPRVINTDKNPAYGEAIAELKKEGRLPKDTQHRQVKYLNNRLECDHGKLKRLIQPTLGFQSMKTAYATIKGFEVMRMFKKGQFAPWIDAICGGTEVHFIHRLFGLYA